MPAAIGVLRRPRAGEVADRSWPGLGWESVHDRGRRPEYSRVRASLHAHSTSPSMSRRLTDARFMRTLRSRCHQVRSPAGDVRAGSSSWPTTVESRKLHPGARRQLHRFGKNRQGDCVATPWYGGIPRHSGFAASRPRDHPAGRCDAKRRDSRVRSGGHRSPVPFPSRSCRARFVPATASRYPQPPDAANPCGGRRRAIHCAGSRTCSQYGWRASPRTSTDCAP